MDPLLAAAAFSTAASTCENLRRPTTEDAFYARHGRPVVLRAAPAAPAIAIAIAIVALTGLFGGA
jgi:hypothetical protein